MLNYRTTGYLAAHHRNDLQRDAEREQLATEASTTTGYSGRHLLASIGQRLASLVRLRRQPISDALPVAADSPTTRV